MSEVARPEIVALQRALAAAGFDPGPVDGIMGPRTRAAMAARDGGAHGTAPVGPSTGARIRSVGAWLWAGDLVGRGADRAHDAVLALGLTDVDLFATPGDSARAGRFTSRLTALECAELAGRYARDGVSAHVTCWLHPGRRYVEALAQYAHFLALAGSVSSIVLDTEDVLGRDGGLTSPALRRIVVAFQGLPIPIGVTSYASMPRRDGRLLLALRGENLEVFAVPQTYSVASTRQGPTRRAGRSAVYMPGSTQSHAARSWGSHLDARSVWGLAAYGQDWPDMSPAEAMGECVARVVALGGTSLRYWSLRTMGGAVGQFVSGLCSSLRGPAAEGGT